MIRFKLVLIIGYVKEGDSYMSWTKEYLVRTPCINTYNGCIYLKFNNNEHAIFEITSCVNYPGLDTLPKIIAKNSQNTQLGVVELLENIDNNLENDIELVCSDGDNNDFIWYRLYRLLCDSRKFEEELSDANIVKSILCFSNRNMCDEMNNFAIQISFLDEKIKSGEKPLVALYELFMRFSFLNKVSIPEIIIPPLGHYIKSRAGLGEKVDPEQNQS